MTRKLKKREEGRAKRAAEDAKAAAESGDKKKDNKKSMFKTIDKLHDDVLIEKAQ